LVSQKGKICLIHIFIVEISADEKTGRKYLQHEYNRDGDSFRSPWTNAYYPPQDSKFFPSSALLEMEKTANDIFTQYVQMYYTSAVSSVYFLDPSEGALPGFNAVYLVKRELEGESIKDKDTNEVKGVVDYGCWDGTHIVMCTLNGANATYMVISSVQITVEAEKLALYGDITIAGQCSKTAKRENVPMPGQNSESHHLVQIGQMIEENEKDLRNEINDQYVNKQR
jgi:capping protein beta